MIKRHFAQWWAKERALAIAKMSRTNAATKAVLLVAYGAMPLTEFSNTAPLLRLLVAVLLMVVLQMLID